MGEIYKASCPSCGYETTLHLGGGLLSINLGRCAAILPEEERNVLLRLKEDGEVREFLVEHKVTKCRKCEKIGSQMIIDITKRNGEKRRFGRLCDTCKEEAAVYEEGADGTYMCPKCGRHILELENTGVWD